MAKKSLMTFIRFISILALVFTGFFAFGSSAHAQTAEVSAPTKTTDELDPNVEPMGLWWAEAQAFAGCHGNGQPAYNGQVWDLKKNTFYTVAWDLTFHTASGSSTSYDRNQQTLYSGSNGSFSVGTHYTYAGSSTTTFVAKLNVYDSNWNRVAHSTSTCKNP